MPEDKDGKEVVSLTPEQIMLGAFEANELPLQRLINWGTLGGSPSPEITQGVLASLVEMEVLHLFSKIEKPKSEMN